MPWVWAGLGDLNELWPESLELDDSAMDRLLEAAREQCTQFAPACPSTTELIAAPASWVLAHVLQTQALWNASKAQGGDTIGPDGVTVTVYPMDWTVKNLLRPKRGVPVVG